MNLPKWAIPAAIGVGLGYLFSGTLNKVLGGVGIHPLAYQGVKVRAIPPLAKPSYVPRAAGGGAGGVSHIVPARPVPRYVPVRRSFDRSYDSWLHNTVNSLPALG